MISRMIQDAAFAMIARETLAASAPQIEVTKGQDFVAWRASEDWPLRWDDWEDLLASVVTKIRTPTDAAHGLTYREQARFDAAWMAAPMSSPWTGSIIEGELRSDGWRYIYF